MISTNISNEELNQNKYVCNLENIKSKYILKQIFDNLQKIKILIIAKYNKKIKNKLDLTINDYKEYSEIEMEIIPVTNKYGKFIHINNEEDESYYHIYFNNNDEKIKRNYIKEDEEIKIIKIIIDYQIKSFKDLFENCECIESIYFKKFYRKNIYNMSNMFFKCLSLKELNLNNFNTNNVIDMWFMFGECLDKLKLKIKSQFKNLKELAFEEFIFI